MHGGLRLSSGALNLPRGEPPNALNHPTAPPRRHLRAPPSPRNPYSIPPSQITTTHLPITGTKLRTLPTGISSIECIVSHMFWPFGRKCLLPPRSPLFPCMRRVALTVTMMAADCKQSHLWCERASVWGRACTWILSLGAAPSSSAQPRRSHGRRRFIMRQRQRRRVTNSQSRCSFTPPVVHRPVITKMQPVIVDRASDY
jgi:hypothetical protein